MSTAELCERLGSTLRQIQWWCEQGVIPCDYVDHRRSFDEGQALVAAIVAGLRDKGVPLRRIRRMKLKAPQGEFLVVTERSRLWCGTDDLIQCVAGIPGPCIVLAVADLRSRLQ